MAWWEGERDEDQFGGVFLAGEDGGVIDWLDVLE